MRALFVLHDGVFIYGANRSISELLKNVKYDYDLMIGRSFTKNPNEAELRQMFGGHLKNIYVVWLPRYRCFSFCKQGLYSECSHVANNFMAFLCAHKRKKLIRKGQYDYIHLNSVILYPLIDSHAKYILHMREFVDQGYRDIKRVKKACESTAGIIYIDEGTKRNTEKVLCNPHNTIIVNPFDMTAVQEVDYEKSLKKYHLSPNNVVFAMLGRIEDLKGSKMVLRSFMKHKNANSRLLIVGDDEHAYAKQCKKMAQSDNRIIFCGVQKDTREVYRISDYIIRGDTEIGMGRTMLEGLYAGAAIIIPCDKAGRSGADDIQEFADRIYLYDVQDESALTAVIDGCSKCKRVNREFKSNIMDYMQQYYAFVNQVIENERD